jgi:hypothetical protein
MLRREEKPSFNTGAFHATDFQVKADPGLAWPRPPFRCRFLCSMSGDPNVPCLRMEPRCRTKSWLTCMPLSNRSRRLLIPKAFRCQVILELDIISVLDERGRLSLQPAHRSCLEKTSPDWVPSDPSTQRRFHHLGSRAGKLEPKAVSTLLFLGPAGQNHTSSANVRSCGS